MKKLIISFIIVSLFVTGVSVYGSNYIPFVTSIPTYGDNIYIQPAPMSNESKATTCYFLSGLFALGGIAYISLGASYGGAYEKGANVVGGLCLGVGVLFLIMGIHYDSKD